MPSFRLVLVVAKEMKSANIETKHVPETKEHHGHDRFRILRNFLGAVAPHKCALAFYSSRSPPLLT